MNAKLIDNHFLTIFPDGFDDIAWNTLGKKHKPDKIIELLTVDLGKENFKRLLDAHKYYEICEKATQLVKKVTVVSVFEKVAFSNYIEKVSPEKFCFALYDFLYNYNEESFTNFVEVLSLHKHEKNSNAAKWPVVSFFKAYQDSNEFVILKPNTTKSVAKVLEVDIEYTTVPSYKTYCNVVNMVKAYKKESKICENQNLMLTQAVLFTVTN